MKKTWSVSNVEVVPMRVSTEEYKLILDEMAELVYRYFCQLPENHTEAPVTDTANAVARTGTDG